MAADDKDAAEGNRRRKLPNGGGSFLSNGM